MSFYLGWIYKKGQRTKIFFRVSTCFSNIFTHYIENLEIYIAFIISEPEFTVWLGQASWADKVPVLYIPETLCFYIP